MGGASSCRDRRRRGAPAGVTLAVALSVVAAACSAEGDDAAESTTTAPSTTVPAPRIDDGLLRLGLLLPTEAPLVADAISTTAQATVAEINAAGGVLGRDVELVPVAEGASASEVTQVVTELVDAGVDGVIGPITSTHAITAVDIASSSDVLTCSPSATASILDDVPDDMLFFRTIASDTVQAVAIAETAENTGARSVSIVHVDDAFGRPYANAVEEALPDRSLRLVSTVGFSTGDDLADLLTTVVDDGADVLVLLAAGPELASLVSVLGTVDPAAFDTVITNDAIRSAANQPIIAELPTSLRSRLTGVAPQIVDRRAEGETAVFGPQVVDCVTLISLAAVQANSDAPRLIGAQMPSVSSGGRLCSSFEACATEINADRQIDYQGPTGLTELNRIGDTSRAWFERFTFDETGADEFGTAGRLQITI
ncbi:MAG: ABC transporter substrate-binding protein [Actinomycetota bacterium]